MSFSTPTPAPSLDILLEKAKNGDQDAFEELLMRYTPLIETQAQSFAQLSRDLGSHDDLRQEACIAFYNAILHFDAAQNNVQFGFFAKECIHNRLTSCLRRMRHPETMLGLEDDPSMEENPESDPASRLVEEETMEDLYRRIRSALSPYENLVWTLYLSGRTAKEIAARTGKAEKSVENAIFRIRRKLRTLFPNP